MSKDKRKRTKAAPITANPLFPAVVALWFGALFGLGSLAVRPSLLEDLVLQSHIDLVIPAAAPPLGVTARILLALLLAAIGAVLGIALARRLTREKPEPRERKRGAKDLSVHTPQVRMRDAHPDAPARRPISAREELGDEHPFPAAPAAGGLLANRRRSLAIMEDEPVFVPHEAAPLPGFNPVQPLDLAALALSTEAPSEPYRVVAHQPAASAPLDWKQPAPLPVAAEATPEPAPISAETALRDDRQVFGMSPPPEPEITKRQIFGVEAEDDHVPQDFVRAAGFQTSVFDTAEPSPLFERAAETIAAPVMVDAPPQHEPVSAPPAVALALSNAEPLPSPSSLGMTDLAARLADSMRRRRERAQAPHAPAAEVAAAMPAPSELPVAASSQPELPAMPAASIAPLLPEAVPAHVGAAAPLAVPAAMRPLALDAFLEDEAGFEDTSVLLPRYIAMPTAQPATSGSALSQPVAASDEAEAPIEATLADVAENNPYASLLELAPTRHAPVRIEEAELPVGAEIEPVVIFPGQTGQVVPLGAPVAAEAADQAGFRRFDAPATAGQGQPVVGASNPPLIAPDEAAQALRAALSNLQRMSGAA